MCLKMAERYCCGLQANEKSVAVSSNYKDIYSQSGWKSNKEPMNTPNN